MRTASTFARQCAAKVAANLHDRLSTCLTWLLAQPTFRNRRRRDIARVRLGTLHSAAHKMLVDMGDDVEELEMFDETASLFVLLTSVKSGHAFGSPVDHLFAAVTGVTPEICEGRIERSSAILAAPTSYTRDNLDRDALRAWPSLSVIYPISVHRFHRPHHE